MTAYTIISTRTLDGCTITIIAHGGRFYADIHRGTRRVKQTLYQDRPEDALALAEQWVKR